eukprot:10587492-Ditylum_brightwellii.AAC.1
MIENTKKLKAQHQEYCLWKSEHRAITTFPCLLYEIRSTVPLVPPSCVTKPLPPPITQTKYALATAQLLGLGQKGPGPSSPVMSVDCTPFWYTPLKLLHRDHQFMLQSQHHACLAGFCCLDTTHQAHRPPPAPDPSCSFHAPDKTDPKIHPWWVDCHVYSIVLCPPPDPDPDPDPVAAISA